MARGDSRRSAKMMRLKAQKAKKARAKKLIATTKAARKG